MARRNPNGYGCVTKLSGNRTKPWIIKITVYDEEGKSKQIPIGYAESEEKGNILLAEYNNNPWDIDREKITLAMLFKRWSDIKLPKLGTSNQQSLKSAYKHCTKYYGMKYRTLKSYHMQDCIDYCGCGYSTQWAIKNLFGHLDRFAFEIDIINKMYSELTTAPPIPETTRGFFSEEKIDELWKVYQKGEVPYTDTVLIFIYTGFRLNELLKAKTNQVDLDEWMFKSGSKTASGKNRIVPIHPRIQPLVQHLVEQGNEYFFSYQGKKFSQAKYYEMWSVVMDAIGEEKTPHEARHTLETRLDNAKANKKCIDMLMGHKSKDVGNRVYNHKTVEQLREAIELLK